MVDNCVNKCVDKPVIVGQPKPSFFYKETPDCTYAAVYSIVNIINGKTYIGQSRSLYERFGWHISNFFTGKRSLNSNLRSDIDKFGWEYFNFRILYIQPTYNEAELKVKEKEFIKEYINNGVQLYNIKY
jgi:group I intron endonuclease